MKRTPLAIAIALALAGCATQPVVKTVYIPVAAECPKVSVPAKPYLPIQSPAFQTASAPAQMRLVTESFATMMEDDLQLRALLVPYTESQK